MILNGEKFACEACIRGHRVAQCQHSDRPLQQVGKKGRPVSQCNHCRTLRKSRSLHTKCKCGSTSRNAMLKQFGAERCRCCEGESCTCAYRSDQSAADKAPVASQSAPPPALTPSNVSEPKSLGTDQSPTVSDYTESSGTAQSTVDSNAINLAPATTGLDNWPLDNMLDLWTTPLGQSLAGDSSLGVEDWAQPGTSAQGLEAGDLATTLPMFDDSLSLMDNPYLVDLFSDLPPQTDSTPLQGTSDWNQLDLMARNNDGQGDWFNRP
ncbi:hypothetical protein ACJZ2D_000894 [Fusarium nematophilum]